MGQPLFELVIFPACIDCIWRELETNDVYGSNGTRRITECRKLPVCKYVEGQDKISGKKEREVADV